MPNPGNKVPKLPKGNAFKRMPFGWIFAIIIFYFLISSLNISVTGVPQEKPYGEFYSMLKNSPEKIKSVTKIETRLEGEFADSSRFFVHIPDNDTELLNLLRGNVAHFKVEPPRTLWTNIFFSLGPVVILK